jgi:hypothetical protein
MRYRHSEFHWIANIRFYRRICNGPKDRSVHAQRKDRLWPSTSVRGNAAIFPELEAERTLSQSSQALTMHVVFVVGIERHNNGGSPQLREGGVRQAPRPRSDGAAVARALRASPSFAPVVCVNTHPT